MHAPFFCYFYVIYYTELQYDRYYLFKEEEMGKNVKKWWWFTLVELIVVITILAILWTIAFISLQWFSRDARDSTRISDITSIKKALSFYATQVWSYPFPDDNFAITYSGWLVWTQWIFGDELAAKLQSISKVPRDPLTNDSYSYSILNSRGEFQVAGILEGDLSVSPFVDSAYAEGRVWKSYVSWDYNGKLAKTSSWATTYILAVPTIISWDISLTDVEALIASGKLVYHEWNTVPASFTWSEFDTSQTLDYSPPEIVVFSWSLDDFDDVNTQVAFIEKLQAAYSWFSLIRRDGEIEKLIDIPVDPTDPSPEVKKIANSIIKEVVSYDAPDYTNVANIPLGPCGLTAQDVLDLNDLFDYTGSPYQFSTSQEWCDLTAISAGSRSLSRPLTSALWKLENLTWLDMRSNGLTWTLPSWIWNMSGLVYFSMSWNSLTWSIPESFSNLTNLQTLRLYSNNLTWTLPVNIWNMTSLERLELQRNGITWPIPSSIWNMSSLELLTLQYNQLSWAIPPEIGNASLIYWLNLSSNNFTWALPSSMWNMSSLLRAYFLSNDFNELPDSLANLTNLILLDFTGNPNLWNLALSFGVSTGAQSQVGITDTWKEMTISGNGSTIDISVN